MLVLVTPGGDPIANGEAFIVGPTKEALRRGFRSVMFPIFHQNDARFRVVRVSVFIDEAEAARLMENIRERLPSLSHFLEIKEKRRLIAEYLDVHNVLIAQLHVALG